MPKKFDPYFLHKCGYLESSTSKVKYVQGFSRRVYVITKEFSLQILIQLGEPELP